MIKRGLSHNLSTAIVIHILLYGAHMDGNQILVNNINKPQLVAPLCISLGGENYNHIFNLVSNIYVLVPQ